MKTKGRVFTEEQQKRKKRRKTSDYVKGVFVFVLAKISKVKFKTCTVNGEMKDKTL